MKRQFPDYVAAIPALFAQLETTQPQPLQPKLFPPKKAIYVFLHEGKPEHVGRTRNLRNRIRGHITHSHYSASFAFKRTRMEMNMADAAYKKEGSRQALAHPDTPFGQEFLRQIEAVKQMQVKYLEVEDPIEQYLLELYAALQYGTCLKEFDTH